MLICDNVNKKKHYNIINSKSLVDKSKENKNNADFVIYNNNNKEA